MQTLLFLHLLAMAVWVGGQLALAAVVVPALRDCDPAQRRAVLRGAGRRFTRLSSVALLVLLVTGTEMARMRGMIEAPPADFLAKLTLVAAIVALTAVHVWAGRRGRIRLSRLASTSALVATLVVVWLGVGL